jgi:GntR family transcriptional regulator
MKDDWTARELPLYLKIKQALLEEIKGMDPGKNRLEPEKILAERFGTSRATVREAMSALIREGSITRWQGRGNFGHPGVSSLDMRIDIDSDFRRLITDKGGRANVTQSEMERKTPSAQMLRRMPEAEGEQVIAFDWIYRDGKNPLINCRVEVLRYLMKELPEGGEPEARLSDFLKRYCDVDIVYTTTWLRSGVDEQIARRLGVAPSSPMLIWDEIFYDLDDRKICFNTIHFHPEKIDLSMLTHF